MPVVDLNSIQLDQPQGNNFVDLNSIQLDPVSPQATSQPSNPSFLQRLGQDLKSRGQKVNEADQAYLSGQQSLPESALQILGNGGIGFINDAVGEGLKSAGTSAYNLANYVAPEQVKALKDYGSNVVDRVAGNNIGDAVVGAGDQIQSALASYGDWSQNNPRASRNIDALANVGSAFAANAPSVKGKTVFDIAPAATKATGTALKTAAEPITNAVLPRADSALVDLAQRAGDFGIPLRLDQIAPTPARKTVQKVSKEIPLSGVKAFEDQQRASFNRALAKTIGQDSNDLGPETIKRFLDDANVKFSVAVGDGNIPFDVTALNNIKSEASDNITKELSDIVGRNIDNLTSQIENGTIPANKLATFRSQLIKRIPKASGEAKSYLGDVVDAIDETVGNTMGPEQKTLLSNARREWRNFRTIEPLLEGSTDGMINPTDLMQRVKSSPYIKASRSELGNDDLVDLARVGKQFLPRDGGSDTFQKSLLGGGAGSLGLMALSNPILAAGVGAKAAIGIGANRALQKLNTSQRAVKASLKRAK